MKLTAALVLVLLSATAQADIFRPAYLELREAGPDAAGTPVYDVLWKVSARVACECRRVACPPARTA